MEIIEENDKSIHGKYKNCKIIIHFADFLGIKKKYHPLQFDDSKIIYIHDFMCDLSHSEKGNGRKLLVMALEYIKTKYFPNENVIVSLLAVSKKRIDASGIELQTNDDKLIRYYSSLGFKKISDMGFMIGSLPMIIIKSEMYNAGKSSKKVQQKKRTSRKKKIIF